MADLARELNLPQTSVWSYVHGRTAAPPDVARAIATFCGESEAALGLTGPRRRGPKPAPGRINRVKVERALERLEWSAARLAREVGVVRQAMSQYLAGTTMPRAGTLKKMVRALGLELDQLVTSEPEEPAKKMAAKSKPVRPAGTRGARKAKR